MNKFDRKYWSAKYRLLVITVLFCFYINQVFSQSIVRDIPKAGEFLKNLKSQKVDTILIYGNGCIGCEIKYPGRADSANTKPTYHCDCPFGSITLYFIWKKQGQNFIRMFDYCSAYKTIALKNNPEKLYSYYQQHLSSFKKEKAFWDNYSRQNKSGKIKFLPPGTGHYSFDELYFNGYGFSLPNYYFVGNNWNFLTWKDTQNNWIKLVKELIKTNNFQWELE